MNGVRCAEIYECRMRWEARMCTFSHSRSLPFSLFFSSSLLRNYLLVVLPGNRRGKKGDRFARIFCGKATAMAREGRKCFHHTLFGKRKTRTLAISGFVFTFPSLYLWQKHRNNFTHSLRCFSTERNKK